MGLPLYLAMTAAEMEHASSLPQNLAYMACHFSPYSTGLSNLPRQLPPDSMLTVNDRTPICGHDPQRIAEQINLVLEERKCASVLLDFQRPDIPDVKALAAFLAKELPCPVAVSHHYASGLSCPVFLPPIPPDTPLKIYVQPWEGREIWLEAALEGAAFTVTKDGCEISPLSDAPPEDCFFDNMLHCHYHMEANDDRALFHLFRTRDDLSALLEEAHSLGVTRAVGLYQELK